MPTVVWVDGDGMAGTLAATRYRLAMIRLARFRLKRALARYATAAVGVIVAAVAAVFLISAFRGDTGGTVSDKHIVTERRCHDRSLTCDPQICYQITYVTEQGSRKIACVPRDK